MSRINYKFPEIFKDRFNRDPKMWSIEEIHDLYIRAKKRAELRNIKSKEAVEKIKLEIDPDSFGKRTIYYRPYKYYKDQIHQYEFTFIEDGKFKANFKTLDLKSREDRLNFILSNSKSFEIGQEWYDIIDLEHMAWKSASKVKDILWARIDKNLHDKFKTCDKKTLVIEIGTKKYFVHVDGEFKYPRFQLKDEFSEDNFIKF